MIKKITRDELVRMREEGKDFKLVDVLSRESFRNEHIKGAISLPVDEIEKGASKLLKKSDLIVTYCASFDCQASTNAAEKLLSLGFKNVLDYKGGLKEYKEGDLPLEGKLHEAAAVNTPSVCSACCC